MSKAGVALAATGVGGTGAAAIATAHKLGAFESYGPHHIATTSTQLEYYNAQCIDKTFGKGKWEIPGGLPVIEKKNQPSIVTLDENKDFQGCLAFNWDKRKEGSVWGGNFRLVWTIAQEDKGFVVHLSGDADTSKPEDMKMKFNGVAYVLGKTNNYWKATHELGLNKKELTKSDMPQNFPKLEGYLRDIKTGTNMDDYWSFLEAGGTKVKEVKDGEETNKHAQWTLTKGTEPKDKQFWSHNLAGWWDHFFGKEKWDMATLIQNIKGKWELVQAPSK